MNKGKVSIDKAPLGQKAADIIRQRIIDSTYAQGTRLVEEELAAEFGISRVCIRDAFLILKSEGIIKREHNKYTEVIKLNQKNIEDMFQLRLVLELMCIEICIKNNNIPIDKLKSCLKALDKNSINSLEYVEADLCFHEAIVKSAQNTYVIDIFKGIKNQLMLLLFHFFILFKEDISVKAPGQHNKIFDFLENGDIKKAQSFLKKHIQNNFDYIIRLNERAKLL